MFTIDSSLVEQVGLFLLLWGAVWGSFCALRVGEAWRWKSEIAWALFALLVSSVAFLWFQGHISFT